MQILGDILDILTNLLHQHPNGFVGVLLVLFIPGMWGMRRLVIRRGWVNLTRGEWNINSQRGRNVLYRDENPQKFLWWTRFSMVWILLLSGMAVQGNRICRLFHIRGIKGLAGCRKSQIAH